MTNAASIARRLVKRQGYLRQLLTDLSKREEAKEAGATEARLAVMSDLQKDIQHAENAITAAEERAATSDRMALAFRHRELPQHPLSRACHLLAVPAPRLNALAVLAEHTAAKCADIAEKATQRLDDADADIRSTTTLALFLNKLPSVKFRRDHVSLKDLRAELHRLSTTAKKAKR